jgi:hypothetical protein
MEIDPSLIFVPVIISILAIFISCWMMQKVIAQLIESIKTITKVLLVASILLWMAYIATIFWTEGIEKGIDYLRHVYDITLFIVRRVPKEISYIIDTTRYAIVQRWNMN